MEYARTSVYELTKLGRKFDVVLFCGVFYHLKHPIMAFEEIGAVTHQTGRLFLEGECLVNYAETIKGEARPFVGNDAYLAKAAASDIPFCVSYPGKYRGADNWIVPNVACLKSWLASGGFEIDKYTLAVSSEPMQRFVGSAVKRSHGQFREHHLV